MNTGSFVGNFDCYIFQDSIEHVIDPTSYLKKIVFLSPQKSTFILSLPICEKIPSHTIEWKKDSDALTWLKKCGLTVLESKKIYVNPNVDLFAEGIEDLHNLVVLCQKK